VIGLALRAQRFAAVRHSDTPANSSPRFVMPSGPAHDMPGIVGESDDASQVTCVELPAVQDDV